MNGQDFGSNFSRLYTSTKCYRRRQFYYLRSFLAGEASAPITGLPAPESCYVHAAEILKERFRDRRRIEQYHL